VINGTTFFSQYFPGAVPAMYLDPQSNMMALAAGISAGATGDESSNEIEPHFSCSTRSAVFMTFK